MKDLNKGLFHKEKTGKIQSNFYFMIVIQFFGGLISPNWMPVRRSNSFFTVGPTSVSL